MKDDLIVKVDELTGEIEILREELNAVVTSKNKLKIKVSELEDDLKKAKEQIKQHGNNDQDDEGKEDVPMAQRKRFTRVEMARVLMERNQVEYQRVFVIVTSNKYSLHSSTKRDLWNFKMLFVGQK